MITVRPIAVGDVGEFLAVQPDLVRRADQAAYLERMVGAGAMRPEWCHVAEDDGRVVGRFAFWSLPSLDAPTAMVLLDVADAIRDGAQRAAIAAALLSRAIEEARAASPPEFGTVLDEPAQTPQWQADPVERTAWLEAAGFTVVRATSRWSFASLPPVVPDRLRFVAWKDAGEDALLVALERVSSGTADARIAADRERLGALGEARRMLDDLRALDSRPGWWELAYDAEDRLVGLVAPAAAPEMTTIGYIGVVPEQRGHRYVDDLLARGTATLRRAMPERSLRADTDLANHAMAAAFERAGYTRFAVRREFEVAI